MYKLYTADGSYVSAARTTPHCGQISVSPYDCVNAELEEVGALPRLEYNCIPERVH